MPIIHAETEAALAEERRLLYVGVTRARLLVLLSWPAARSPGGRPIREPSRFLALRRRANGVRDMARSAAGSGE